MFLKLIGIPMQVKCIGQRSRFFIEMHLKMCVFVLNPRSFIIIKYLRLTQCQVPLYRWYPKTAILSHSLANCDNCQLAKWTHELLILNIVDNPSTVEELSNCRRTTLLAGPPPCPPTGALLFSHGRIVLGFSVIARGSHFLSNNLRLKPGVIFQSA